MKFNSIDLKNKILRIKFDTEIKKSTFFSFRCFLSFILVEKIDLGLKMFSYSR